MNLLPIVLSLIFFHGNSISGADDNELKAIDVLSTIKTTSPECDLRAFVKHKDDYTAFSADLKTYCASDSKKENRILCHMIAYELKKACQFDKDGRPSPVIYSKKSTPKEICFSKTIQLTNQWIWNAITNNGQKQIDVTVKELCNKVADDEATRQLARFFYRAAPHVRNLDLSTTSKDGTKSNLGKQTLTESISKADGATTAIKDKTKTGTDDAKDDADQTIDKAKTKNNGTAKTLTQKLTDGVVTVKSKLGEEGQAVKQKVEKTAENAKEKVEKTVSDAKDKTGDAGEPAKGKTDDDGESRKEKADKTAEKSKQKVDDNDDDGNDANDKTKTKSDNDDNDDADKDKTGDTKKKVDEDADNNKDKLTDVKKLSKDIGDKVVNGTKTIVGKGKEFLKKLTNTTGTGAKATDDQGKVLDLNQDKKTDQNADEEDEEGEKKDVDGNGDGKAKDDGQAKQIPKPSTTDKKDDAKNDVEVTAMQKAVDRTTVVVGVQSSNKTLEVTTPSPIIDLNPQKITEPEKKKPTDAVKDADADQDDDDKDDYTQHKVDDMDKKDQLAGNKDDDNDGISLRKPNANDKYTAKPVAADPNKGKSRAKPQVGRKYSDNDGWSGSFVTYFLLFTLFVVVGYLVLHNKNKLKAYALEGRRTSGSRTGSRPSHRGYEKLKNINDIIPIDDTNPVSDKEAVILKA
ncbi:unnamed protein product [Adineta ricciae]|uniref:Uncharacterized protein n=1 Tax=Adineta ricciae TaxID=249248 RepID=A0A815RWE6_ADIRI|nr:unnamed protein product [Adineta ricciae]